MGEPLVARIEQENACANPSGRRSGIARGRGGLCSEEERAEADEGGDPEAEHPAEELGLEPAVASTELNNNLNIGSGPSLAKVLRFRASWRAAASSRASPRGAAGAAGSRGDRATQAE